MSSILDALKKLEAEKAEAAALAATPVSFEDDTREDALELLPPARRITIRATPLFVVVAVILAGAIMVGMSVGVSVLVMSRREPSQVVAQIPPAAPSQPATEPSPDTSVATPPPFPDSPAVPSVEPAPVVAGEPGSAKPDPAEEPSGTNQKPANDAPKPAVSVPVKPVEITPPPAKASKPEPPASAEKSVVKESPPTAPVKPAASARNAAKPPAPAGEEERPVPDAAVPVAPAPSPPPMPEPVEEPKPGPPVLQESASPVAVASRTSRPDVLRTAPRKSVAQQPAATPRTNPLNIFAYPVLKESDKARYNLTELKLNMVRPATKSRPVPSALINLQSVYVGEPIPNTDAKLIAVDMRGIAIEIIGSGEKFHIPF